MAQIDAQVKKKKPKKKNIIEQLRKKKKKFDRMQYLEDSSTFFISLKQSGLWFLGSLFNSYGFSFIPINYMSQIFSL